MEKFWNYVEFHRLPMRGVNIEKHRFEKRCLLDVLSTYVPNDEIFLKSYMPPIKATRLDQIKTIDMPPLVLQGLPESIRKTKR